MLHLVRAICLLTILCVAGSNVALANMWKAHQEECEENAFDAPDEASLEALQKCVRLFEAYRSVAKIKKAEKKRVIFAMTRLYQEGNPTDAHIARLGLMRLGESVANKGGSASGDLSEDGSEEADIPKREKCDHPEPSSSEKKKANKEFKKGLKLYRKKKYEDSLTHMEAMMEIAPGWSKSLRNAAGLNAITDNQDRSLELLQCLKDMGTDEHIAQLKKVRNDDDFVTLHDNPEFKAITGFARVALVDTLQEGRGEENMDNLEEILDKLNYEVDRKEIDKEQKRPTIFYRLHSKVPAYLISKMIDHPSLGMDVMPAKYKEKPYDVIVLWGDRYKEGEDPKVRVASGQEAEEMIADIERKENEILSEPDKYERKVNKVLNAPDKATTRINRTGRKVDRILKKPGKAIDKIKKIGDKLRKPF